MTEPLSATHQYLLAHYRPLLTVKHLAEVLHLSPNGVRMAIVRKRQPLAVALGEAATAGSTGLFRGAHGRSHRWMRDDPCQGYSEITTGEWIVR